MKVEIEISIFLATANWKRKISWKLVMIIFVSRDYGVNENKIIYKMERFLVQQGRKFQFIFVV